MHPEKPVYLVDTNSPLIHAWPSLVFFLGDTHVPLIYEFNSLFDLVISLPVDYQDPDIAWHLEKHDLCKRITDLHLPALCVTNPNSDIENGTFLSGSGFFSLPINDDLFRLDPSFTLKELLEYEITKKYHIALDKMPLTMPVSWWSPIPYIDHKLDLIINHHCDDVWKWWQGGLSPGIIIRCLRSVLPRDIYEKLQQNHPVPHKDQHPRQPAS